jgi:hypothetical protein
MLTAFACDKDDPNDPKNSVPDPPGTITANISDDISIGIDYDEGHCGSIGWCSPDNFRLFAGGGYYESVSICNLGVISGLGNITRIPTSGFTVPSRSNSSIACEEGYGYVIKFESERANKGPVYVRLYVVESIVSTTGGIMGAKVRYQYPFVP